MFERQPVALVLVSGGMDSVTLLHYVRKVLRYTYVIGMGINYGQKHIRELEFAEKNCKMLEIPYIKLDLSKNFVKSVLTDKNMDVPKAEEDKQHLTVVNMRNTIFITEAIKHIMDNDVVDWRAGLDVFYAPTMEDFRVYPDCREDYVNSISEAVRLGSGGFIRGVYAPFLKDWKAGIIILGIAIGVDYNLTYTCYNGGEKPCQEKFCDACSERIMAFVSNGLRDPLYNEEEWDKVLKEIGVGVNDKK